MFNNFWPLNLLFWVIKPQVRVVDSLSTCILVDNQNVSNFIDTMLIKCKVNKFFPKNR